MKKLIIFQYDYVPKFFENPEVILRTIEEPFMFPLFDTMRWEIMTYYDLLTIHKYSFLIFLRAYETTKEKTLNPDMSQYNRKMKLKCRNWCWPK